MEKNYQIVFSGTVGLDYHHLQNQTTNPISIFLLIVRLSTVSWKGRILAKCTVFAIGPLVSFMPFFRWGSPWFLAKTVVTHHALGFKIDTTMRAKAVSTEQNNLFSEFLWCKISLFCTEVCFVENQTRPYFQKFLFCFCVWFFTKFRRLYV